MKTYILAASALVISNLYAQDPYREPLPQWMEYSSIALFVVEDVVYGDQADDSNECLVALNLINNIKGDNSKGRREIKLRLEKRLYQSPILQSCGHIKLLKRDSIT